MVERDSWGKDKRKSCIFLKELKLYNKFITQRKKKSLIHVYEDFHDGVK